MVRDGPKAYEVELTAPNRFLSVRGFATVRDARAWIAEQKASEEKYHSPFHPLIDRTDSNSRCPILLPLLLWRRGGRLSSTWTQAIGFADGHCPSGLR